MNAFFAATHLVVFFAAMLTTRFRRGAGSRVLTVALGVVCVPIFTLLILLLLVFTEHPTVGTTGVCYFIYSVVSFGLVPILSHTCAAVSGDCASLVLQRFRRPRTPAVMTLEGSNA